MPIAINAQPLTLHAASAQIYAGIIYESRKQGFSYADWKKSKESE